MRGRLAKALSLVVLATATFAVPAQAAHHRHHHKHAPKPAQVGLTLGEVETAARHYAEDLTIAQENLLVVRGSRTPGYRTSFTCALLTRGAYLLSNGAYSLSYLSPLPGQEISHVPGPLGRCVVTSVPSRTQSGGTADLSCTQYVYAWPGSAPKLPFKYHPTYRYCGIIIEAYDQGNGCAPISSA